MPPYLMSPAFTFRRQDKSHLLQATISAQIHRPRPKNPQVSATSESTIPDREPSRVSQGWPQASPVGAWP
jgi:hypothetical protein